MDENNDDYEDHDQPNFNLFSAGNAVVVETNDGIKAGPFLGMLEYGIAIRMTIRQGDAQTKLAPSSIAAIRSDLKDMTVAELKEIAVDEEISLSGLTKKEEIVSAITSALILDIEAGLAKKVNLVELAVPITTFIPWQEIVNIYDGAEWVKDQEVAEFRDSMPDIPIIPQDNEVVPPGPSEPTAE